MEKWTTTQKMIWLRGNPATGGGGNPEIDLTVTGNPPLSLPNASAKPLVKLTQFGNTWFQNDSTPTPSSPQTLRSNTGMLRFYDTAGLPDDYRRIKGMVLNGNTYFVVPDLYLTGYDTVSFSIAPTAACNVFGCYTTTSAQDNYSLYVSTTSNAKYLRYNGGTYKSYWSNAALGQRYDITIGPEGSYGMPSGQDDEWETVEFEASVEMCIGTTATNATSSKFKGTFYGDFVVDGMFGGIPCERIADGTIGYFDTVGWQFIEPIGDPPVSLGYDMDNYTLEWEHSSESVMLNGGNAKWMAYPLNSCGNVKDEYEFVTGRYDMRIDFRYLTGEETYTTSTAYGSAVVITSAASAWSANSDCTPVCSHFVGLPRVGGGTQAEGTCFFDTTGHFYFRTSMSASDFKAWVTAQYMAGTPVILQYAMATPQTSIMQSWQPTLVQGDNTVSVLYVPSDRVTVSAVYKGREG